MVPPLTAPATALAGPLDWAAVPIPPVWAVGPLPLVPVLVVVLEHPVAARATARTPTDSAPNVRRTILLLSVRREPDRSAAAGTNIFDRTGVPASGTTSDRARPAGSRRAG